MTDEPSSMFDYDARPVTPQVVLVGRRASSLGYELRDFLSRNGVPYDWVEIDDADRARPPTPGSYVSPIPRNGRPEGPGALMASLKGVPETNRSSDGASNGLPSSVRQVVSPGLKLDRDWMTGVPSRITSIFS